MIGTPADVLICRSPRDRPLIVHLPVWQVWRSPHEGSYSVFKSGRAMILARSIERMAAQNGYRFLSARPPQRPAVVPYLPAGDPSLPRRSREPLDQYPYLRGLGLSWLDRYHETDLDAADAFVAAHEDGIDLVQAGHDLSVYLCNWVVMNSRVAQWFLDPRARICYVELPGRKSLLDPYRHVVTCLTDRVPVAHRFTEQARHLGA